MNMQVIRIQQVHIPKLFTSLDETEIQRKHHHAPIKSTGTSPGNNPDRRELEISCERYNMSTFIPQEQHGEMESYMHANNKI